jgi:hypothetical protein
MLAFVVRLFGCRKTFPISIINLMAYTIMVGASTWVMHASVIELITLWAIYLRRRAQMSFRQKSDASR